jgi:hypothetical protein
MSLIATDECLADLVSNLSEAFSMFSNEAVKLSALLARSENPVSSESYYELHKQCIAEVQAFEEYLNQKEGIFAYLNVVLPESDFPPMCAKRNRYAATQHAFIDASGFTNRN